MATQQLVADNQRLDLSGNVIYCKAIKTGYYTGGASNMSSSESIGAVNAGTSLTLGGGLHEGLTVQMNAATGSTVTLPAATGSGNYYNVLVTTTVTSNNHIFKTDGTGTFAGTITIAGTTSLVLPATGTNKTITMNGTTTGGIVGTYFTVIDIATNLWYIEANIVASGTVSSPVT